MADYTKYFEKPAGELLELGEQFLAGTPCLPRGHITKRLFGAAAFGAAGDSVAATGNRGEGQVYVGQELPSTVALGVTQNRLMVFGLNVASGRPNRVLYDIPITDIVRIDSSTGRSVGMKKLEVDIVLSNGATLSLDVPREHVRKGSLFVEAATSARNFAVSRLRIDGLGSEESVQPEPEPSVATPLAAVSTTPGWYGVTGERSVQRYWDGTAWTHQVHWDGHTWRQII
jgi:hypothetical protein